MWQLADAPVYQVRDWIHLQEKVRQLIPSYDTHIDDLLSRYGLNEIDIGAAIVMHIARHEHFEDSRACPDFASALAHVPLSTRLVVVTDDGDWCKQHALLRGALVVEETFEPHALGLVRLFSRHVLTGSLLGWWAAFLANGADVVAPDVWFSGNLA
jgi:hypothetical protein